MKILIVLLIPFFLYASSYNRLLIDYKEAKYKSACKRGIKLFRKGEKNEKILSLIGDSCARCDYINILGEIQKYQKKSKDARENASYFTTLVLQKRLIFQFMHDDLDLSNLKLPKTSHILSKVFINLSNKNFDVIAIKPKKVRIESSNGDEYTLYISPTGNRKIYIEEKKESGKVIVHRYK